MMTFNEFIDLIHKTEDRELLEDFFLGLTTPHERRVLTRRIEIVSRLLKDEAQHEIANSLGVGVSTVTRGARELSLGRFKVLRKNK